MGSFSFYPLQLVAPPALAGGALIKKTGLPRVSRRRASCRLGAALRATGGSLAPGACSGCLWSGVGLSWASPGLLLPAARPCRAGGLLLPSGGCSAGLWRLSGSRCLLRGPKVRCGPLWGLSGPPAACRSAMPGRWAAPAVWGLLCGPLAALWLPVPAPGA
jgi:hypothetical protein